MNNYMVFLKRCKKCGKDYEPKRCSHECPHNRLAGDNLKKLEKLRPQEMPLLGKELD